MSPLTMPARTYNQDHVPRRYTAGRRRVSIYWTWSYPWESNRDLTEMDNRFSTMTEVRRGGVAGVRDAGVERTTRSSRGSPARSSCSIARRSLSRRSSGRSPATRWRCSSASTRPGYRLPIDERILADTDTLMVFGLDHLVSEQEASPEEIEAIASGSRREGTCLLLAPHHDVGFIDDFGSGRWSTPTTATRWCRASSASASTRAR